MRTCAGCDIPIGVPLRERNKRKWCSEACRLRVHRASRADAPCAVCGKMLWGGRGSLPHGERTCRQCRSARALRAGGACMRCGGQLMGAQTKWCSAYCREQSRVLTPPAAVCAASACTNSIVTHKGRRYCSRKCGRAAEAARRDLREPGWRQAKTRVKNHRRRGQTRLTDITLSYELQLRVKAKRCPLCQVRLVNEPLLPASKELDHIVPRLVGGTHTIGNVRIICRSCNARRPKDGSDYVGPVTLWAQDFSALYQHATVVGRDSAVPTAKMHYALHTYTP